MKTLNLISGIAIIGLLFLSSSNYAQIPVDNNTCHSMFVTANWGTYNPSCAPCSSCAASGVIGPTSSGSIGTMGPTGSEILLHLTASLNAYSGCSQDKNAWEDCNGYSQTGKSDCCVERWIVRRDAGTIIIDPNP